MNRRRLAWVCLLGLAACETDAPPPATDQPGAPPYLTGIRYLASEATGVFERALAPREFSFPRDHGSHPEFRTEWWYFTGNLFSPQGRHYGFELTFFRVGLDTPRPERASAWATNTIWMAHFALTDTRGARFFAAERLSRGALGLAGADSSQLHVHVEDWSVTETDAGTLRLLAATDTAAIDVELSGLDRIVLQGDRGLDAKGPEAGNASYYYSAPRLAVRGSVRAGEAAAEAVEGLAWMDREWSTSALSAGIAGWDWFALQLDDGRDLMFYRMRDANGSASPFSTGSITAPDGTSVPLSADDVELEATRWWQSPASDTTYPVAWRMRIPGADLELDIEPYLPDQELDLTVRYWEGAVRVSGRADGRAIAGNGYLELAGY